MEGMPKNNNKKIENELNAAHLNSPDLAVMTCVGPTEYFKKQDGSYDHNFQSLIEESEPVNFHATVEELDSLGIENNGEQTYVISGISEKPKRSTSFYNCTGVIAVGRDKEAGKNISFVTHQEPSKFLSEFKDEFNDSFTSKLNELKNLSEQGTIDVVIIGGNYLKGGHNRKYRENYITSVADLTETINSVYGFNPIIASGPKLFRGKDGFLFDTEKRQLYLLRDEDTENRDINHAYTIDTADSEKEIWDKPFR